MRYYMIRHKASGEFMPQANRDRGYSHWNPATGVEFFAALPVPRLIDTRRRAAKIINMWVIMPNSEKYEYQSSYDGEYEVSVRTKPDGRTKDDLEIVEVNIEEVKHEQQEIRISGDS